MPWRDAISHDDARRSDTSPKRRDVLGKKEGSMRRVLCAISLSFLLSTVPGFPQQPSAPPGKAEAGDATGRLPVQRVVLYKNGVGYFEHTARAHGTEDLNIDFSTAQLNDVLKSLTVVDLGQGHITGIRFNSVAPLEERLRSLHLGLGPSATRAQLLDALRGTRVDVKGPAGGASGRILSVEWQKRPAAKGEGLEDVLTLSLVTDTGELRTFDLDPGVTARVADRELDEEVGRYLNLIGSARAMDVRRMTISAAGEGDRDVFVSYISEVPVWKSTYRILLGGQAGSKALIQGWAIVDNTLGEDWKNVRLSLVAGAPQSFVQNISVPYYVRRPEVPLPQSVTLTPQTYEAANAFAPPPPPAGAGVGYGVGGGLGPGSGGGTGGGVFSVGGGAPGLASLEGVIKDPSGAAIPNANVTVRNEATGATQITHADVNGHYSFRNVQPGNSMLSVFSPGFQRYELSNIYLGAGRMNTIQPTLDLGAATETVTVRASAPTVATESASIASLAESLESEAEGKRVGEQFSYDIKEKVTIGKNQSALVPIVQAHVDANKVTVWKKPNVDDDDDQPVIARRALWLTNSSGLTLDGGTFNVLEDDVFQGEGLLDAIRPGEKRLVSYAGDPAVRVMARTKSDENRLRRVQIMKGVMVTTREDRRSTEYTVSDADSQPREVVIEHPNEEGWKPVGDTKPVETTPAAYRYVVKVDPKQSAKLRVEESRAEKSTVELGDLSGQDVQLFIEQKDLTPALHKALEQMLARKNALNDLDAQMKEQQREEQSISSDQSRLRENMKALKGTAEEKALVQRYVGELNAQEDKLAALRARYTELKTKRDQAQAQLDQTVQQISLDETL
jgi:hypothetical protein